MDIFRLFRKKQPGYKATITQEQLQERALKAVQQVIFTQPIPQDEWELTDRKRAAMDIFMTDLPFQLGAKDASRTTRFIDKCEQLIRDGQWWEA